MLAVRQLKSYVSWVSEIHEPSKSSSNRGEML